jgi:hypothetical protein
MALDTMDKLVAALTGAKQTRPWVKTGASSAASLYMSHWRAAGTPGVAAIPSTADAPTDATAGAFALTNPAGGQKAYLAGLRAGGPAGCTTIFYDRLSHQGGLSGTATGAQTTNLPTAAITRPDALGADVEIWLEWYTTTGSTGVTVTASYTNQAGTSGQTTEVVTLPVSVPSGRMYQLPLAGTDTGARSVESVTLSASTGTAGNFGVTLLRRLDEICAPASGIFATKGPFDTRLPEIYPDACIAMMAMNTGANAAWVGGIDIIVG